MPAEFTRIRSSPSSVALSTAPVIWPVSVTSTWANAPPISSARAWPFSSWTSATTTVAPAAASCRATAPPMPDAPPVISATEPEISMWRSLASGSEVGLAVSHDHGRTCQVHLTGIVSRHVDRAAGDVDPPPSGTVGRGGQGGRARAGATRPGLAGATLMDAHRHVVTAAAYDELHVDAAGIQALVVRRLLEQRAGLGEVLDHHHRVRVARVDVDGGPRPVTNTDLGLASDRRRAHRDGVGVAVAGDRLHAVARGDAHRPVSVHQPLV